MFLPIPGGRPSLLSGSGLSYPPGLDLDRVVRLVGPAQPVEAVAVAKMETEQTTLGRLREKFAQGGEVG